MKRAVTLKENYEFRRMYQKGASAAGGCMVIYCRRNKLDHNRLGLTASVKLGHAVVRNRARRRLREVYRRITGADIAVSVTGVAGPDPDERGVPVGIVFIGLATPDGIFCRPLDLGKRRRDRIQDLSSNHALDVVRRYLAGLPVTLS